MPFDADKIFKAIGERKRRDILALLVGASTAMNISDISTHFDDTRQAVTKHIKQLEDAGLIIVEKEGREGKCKANPKALFVVHQWLQTYEKFWKGKLDDLDDFLNSDNPV